MTVTVPDFESSAVFAEIDQGLCSASDKERQEMIKKVKGVFQLDVKNKGGKVQAWTIDMKKEGKVTLGKPSGKPDIVISVADKDFVDMSSGKLNGQKAFMQGKLKVKGNMMLATKLDGVLKNARGPKAKL